MDYRIAGAKLQNLEAKTVRITATASELGTVTATTITIPLSDLGFEDIAATDVLVAHNYTDDTKATPSIVGSNLVLTDAAIAATDIFELVYRIK
jgi:hypothetical protein